MTTRETTRFPHLFTPVRVGRVEPPNRIMATPHATPIGNLRSPDEAEADRNIAYWAARARAGLGWVEGISAALENRPVPGFEPTGVGAVAHGVFRLPHIHDRIRRLTATLHEAEASVTAQIIMQGGMPHGPSPTATADVANQVSHALDRDATADVLAFGADVVAVATGAAPRPPAVPGADAPLAVDGRAALTSAAPVSERVMVVAAEDHMQPLSITGSLTDHGHRVHLGDQTPGPAPLVGKYSVGAPLAKLTAAGAEFTFTNRVARIEEDQLQIRNVYSDTPGEITGFDSVVVAAGGRARRRPLPRTGTARRSRGAPARRRLRAPADHLRPPAGPRACRARQGRR